VSWETERDVLAVLFLLLVAGVLVATTQSWLLRGLVLVVVAAAVLLIPARQHGPGVLSWSAGPCAVDWYQGRALVWACPGHDLLRLWPLPPASPWFEDPPQPPPSQITAARGDGQAENARSLLYSR